MRKYRLVAKKGEGTFSEVLKAQNVKDGKYHAIKCMKNRFESIDQVNNLREIQALRRLSPHEHIITLEEVLFDQPSGRLALVFELMDANLYEIIRGRRHHLQSQVIMSYMYQLLKALDHMHRKGIFHRDIKPENILVDSTADIGCGLKLADFGSCRGIYSKQPYTEYISTRWYRAPECLLTDGYYGPEMDLWGSGCVMFEITSLYPLFPGTNEVDQINRVHKILGTPNTESLKKLQAKGASHINFDFGYQPNTGIGHLIPHASSDAVDLIVQMLKYDSSDRISAREALQHSYMKEMRDMDARKVQMARLSQQENNGQNSGRDSYASAVMPKLVDNSGNSVSNLSAQYSQATISTDKPATLQKIENNQHGNIQFQNKTKLPLVKQPSLESGRMPMISIGGMDQAASKHVPQNQEKAQNANKQYMNDSGTSTYETINSNLNNLPKKHESNGGVMVSALLRELQSEVAFGAQDTDRKARNSLPPIAEPGTKVRVNASDSVSVTTDYDMQNSEEKRADKNKNRRATFRSQLHDQITKTYVGQSQAHAKSSFPQRPTLGALFHRRHPTYQTHPYNPVAPPAQNTQNKPSMAIRKLPKPKELS